MHFLKTTLFVLSITVAGTVIAQPTAIVVNPGQKFKVESTVKVNSSADVMGQTMESNADSKNTTIYHVKNVTGDDIVIESTIKTMVISANAMGQEMSFDSDKNDNSGQMAELLGPKINKAMSITLDKKGMITRRDEEASSQGAIMGLDDQNSASTDLFLPALLGRILKAGDSFTDQSTVKKENYSSRDSGTYTVTAIENGVASISYKGTQVIEAVMEQMGMEMTNNSTNTVTTEIQMDINTGLIKMKASKIESTISIEASGMSIPATGKTITTVTITPVD